MKKVFAVPIETRLLPLTPHSLCALEDADSYNWILFTSAHAVKYFAQYYFNKRRALPNKAQIGAVGPSTAKALTKLKLKVSLVPAKHTVEHLVRSLPNITGTRILFPRSALAPQDAIKTLRARGARVRVVSLYTTHVPQIALKQINALMQGKFSALSFRSPSAIHGLLTQCNQSQCAALFQLRAYCIGPTTARVAREAGFRKVTDIVV